MNARNFDKLMTEEIGRLGEKKRLLLHCCCAPCSSACLERLKEHFEITALFYNPNIEDEEYLRRKEELIRFIRETGWSGIMEYEHDAKEFYRAVKGFENEIEGGKRCAVCFKLRLEKTASLADEGGFDYFSTTLTISPLKNSELINSIGEELAKSSRAKWLYSDFKKRNGYLKSLTLSKEYGLYRQNYCGCVYSRENT